MAWVHLKEDAGAGDGVEAGVVVVVGEFESESYVGRE